MNIREVYINWKYVPEDYYVRDIETLRSMEPLVFHSPVTFFAGENGTGKSTLLEAIATAYGFNPEGGSMNYSFSTYDSHSELSHALTVVKDPFAEKYGYFLRAESFYNVATAEELRYSDITHPSMKLHERSHGESFLAIMEKYMDSSGMFILDEPEAALSQQRQMTLLMYMHSAVKQGAQFIIATHSPILLAYPDAEILSFDSGYIHPVRYEETDSYQITKLFVNNKEYILKKLFEE